MPSLVAVVGKSEAGKTTFIEGLVGELKSRGYRVATVKHAHHGTTFDEPGKDSWRHLQAGSEATALVSPDKFVLIRRIAPEADLNEMVRLFGEDYDIILAEGFKESDAPKIEVHRKEVSAPFDTVKKLVAIVTDEPLETKARQFSFADVKGVADLLEEGFIKPQRERLSLYVNGAPVPLSIFPREIFRNTLLGMVSSLKGVGEVKSLDISLRIGPNHK